MLNSVAAFLFGLIYVGMIVLAAACAMGILNTACVTLGSGVLTADQLLQINVLMSIFVCSCLWLFAFAPSRDSVQ